VISGQWSVVSDNRQLAVASVVRGWLSGQTPG